MIVRLPMIELNAASLNGEEPEKTKFRNALPLVLSVTVPPFVYIPCALSLLVTSTISNCKATTTFPFLELVQVKFAKERIFSFPSLHSPFSLPIRTWRELVE